MIRLITLLLFLATPTLAEEIVLGLSQDKVAITANFDGSNILVFGAVKRDAPIPDTSDLGVIITVSGPNAPATVRRKSREFGIWINTQSVEVDDAPTFYAVASNAPIADILRDVEDLRHKITIPRAIRSVGATVDDSAAFTQALIRIRAGEDLYQVRENSVELDQDTLFRTAVNLPSNLTEGTYEVRILLTRDGRIIDEFSAPIPVQKVGLERWLYNLAQDQAWLYGLLSLVIAVVAGWLASAAFQLLRR